jgi:hypothetical protein
MHSFIEWPENESHRHGLCSIVKVPSKANLSAIRNWPEKIRFQRTVARNALDAERQK